jgi:exopolyphosphatase/guanosine-5'-triphosphate,3'-diphosphate pyrophosphatase
VAINRTAPKRIAAIDAGSNAIRLVIAQTRAGKAFSALKTVRWPVRLGHGAFLRRKLDRSKMAAAVRAFREAKDLFEEFGVESYRAVATSAAREARNAGALVRRIYRETEIRLEIISAEEEARLVRTAVVGALGKSERPRLVLDLGGGSLELCLMQRGEARHTVALPLGTVRLLETFRLGGAISENDAEELAHYAHMILESYWPDRPMLLEGSAVACGGNAEALARLFPGPRWGGVSTINLHLLRDQLWRILHLDVEARMEEFRVRRDRAEVMGVAAILFATVGKWLRIRSFLVPGVGVREGILRDMMASSSGQSKTQRPAARPGEAKRAYAGANR